MPTPTNLAAIDAGANAIRLVIARAESPSKLRILESERYRLRLGRPVFQQHRFDRETLNKAALAFRHFKSLMDLYDIQTYRAVATSATREAQNQRTFIQGIYDSSGIRLEVIDAAEEARLVRCAVKASVAGKLLPQWIADLGGGSLEISRMKSALPEQNLLLPIGTVRMMEMFDIQGAMTAEQRRILKSYIVSLFRRFLVPDRQPRNELAVACGGNAEALALIAPGVGRNGVKTLDVRVLRRKLGKIVAMDINERIKAFHVRKDRAEVMGIAAIIFETLGRWWNMDSFLVPAVGVKEGVLIDLLRSFSGPARQKEAAAQAGLLLSSARRYASRLDWDAKHSEKVCQLAVSLFDQLQPLHNMGGQLRLTLALAALLHDVGHVVHYKSHHQHGEYLVRHGEIAGLEPARRDMIACIARYHSEPDPDADHEMFTSFPRKQQLQIRMLVAILRIADALDFDHRQGVTGVHVKASDRELHFGLEGKHSASDLILWAARRRAGLFEAVFDRKAEFQVKR